jgi:hypothetical protein
MSRSRWTCCASESVRVDDDDDEASGDDGGDDGGAENPMKIKTDSSAIE